MQPGYNFTSHCRSALGFAREATARFRHRLVDADHVLLGLIEERDGRGAQVLGKLAGDLAELQRAVESALPPSHEGFLTGSSLLYTARAKRVIAICMATSRELGHTYIGTEHLLLGFLREGQALSIPLLTSRGVTFDRAREDVLRVLDGET
jgi:ATP-dependent Clp protease ATP-binding subunit ClpC